MELYPIQGGVVVLLVALCMETRISSGLGGGGGSLGSSTGFTFHEFAGLWLSLKPMEEECKLKYGSIAVNILEYAQKNKEVKKSFSLFPLSCRL